MKRPFARNILLGMLFLVLLLPLMQQNIFFFDFPPLNGYYSDAPETQLTWKKWFDGSFQQEENNYLNDHMGLRPGLIRINAQVDYTLFWKMDYGGVTVGSDNYLYYTSYIDAYYGRDYVGHDSLYSVMRQLKAVQDTLTRLGKTMLLVYAPCKVWFYPQHVPQNLRSVKRPNNYLTCRRIGDSLGLHQADLNSWYLGLKDTSREVLYSKWGIHWTNYGSILALDTLERYIEHDRHIHMVHPQWTKTEHTYEARMPDNDMGGTLNLLFPPKTELLCYPELFYKVDSSTTTPNLILVGDSYNINFIRTGVLPYISSNWEFWFYFKEIVNAADWDDARFIKMNSYNWHARLDSADAVILLYTPMNTGNIGDGFIQSAYHYYYPGRQ